MALGWRAGWLRFAGGIQCRELLFRQVRTQDGRAAHVDVLDVFLFRFCVVVDKDADAVGEAVWDWYFIGTY